MKFRVFATRVQASPPPSPMRLEVTLVEEITSPGTHGKVIFSRAFDQLDKVATTLASSDMHARYKAEILATCDRAMREWNLLKSSDTVIEIDRKQLGALDFSPGIAPTLP